MAKPFYFANCLVHLRALLDESTHVVMLHLRAWDARGVLLISNFTVHMFDFVELHETGLSNVSNHHLVQYQM